MMREFSTRVLVSIIRAPYQNLEVMAWVMGVKNRRLNWCQQPYKSHWIMVIIIAMTRQTPFGYTPEVRQISLL